MANNRKSFLPEGSDNQANNETALSLVDMPGELITYMGSFLQDRKDQCTYVRLCRLTYNFFHEDLDVADFNHLLQAVIEGEADTVKKILDNKPKLLLRTPKKNQVIKSKLTGQIFYAEEVALIAAKLRQFEVFNLLLSYFDKLEQTSEVQAAKALALSAWKVYKNNEDPCDFDNVDIVIFPEYREYAKSLFDILMKETFPQGEDHFGYGCLSEETEKKLEELFNKILPNQAVKLEDYPDVQQLLLAVIKVYKSEKKKYFALSAQQNAFCIRVIGLIQSVQNPEVAKIFCHNANQVVTAMVKKNKIEMSSNARVYKMQDDRDFYRSSRDAKVGLGFDYVCGESGRGCVEARQALPDGFPNFSVIELIFSKKNNEVENSFPTKTMTLRR